MKHDLLERIAIFSSPFPVVDLTAPAVPSPGKVFATPRFCKKAFPRGECAQFYQRLGDNAERLQCPFGFSVWPMTIGKARLAVTGLIGAPRLGGEDERLRAKEYSHHHVAAESVTNWAADVSEIVAQGDIEREREFARRLEALHEIRRFNQIIKTNMERACYAESPDDPDAARLELVRAHRASSLISVQLDALDLLANPASAMSFAPQRWVFYKIVDKMVRMYQVVAENRQVILQLSGRSVADVRVDLRTIHVVPSVFIDNAVKYSAPGERVRVHVADELRANIPVVTLEVTSRGPVATPEEEENLFLHRGRGRAARDVAEGSGIGLTLAKVVADQHRAWIHAEQRQLTTGRAEWIFRFQIPRIQGKGAL